MKKKTIIIIILCIILIIIAGLVIFSHSINNTIKVGQTNFNIPQGYAEVYTKNNSANIIKGKNSIGIVCYDDNNINEHVNNYTLMKKNESIDIETREFNINNIQVFKSNAENDNSTIHYWFINNNKVYEICSWNGDSNTDNIARNLIESTNSNFLSPLLHT